MKPVRAPWRAARSGGAALLILFAAFSSVGFCRRGSDQSAVPGPVELAALAKQSGNPPRDLNAFWDTAGTFAHPLIAAVARRARAGATFERDSAEERTFFRLIGLYARKKYEAEMIVLLGRMVALPTFARPDRPQHRNPAIIEFGQLLAREAGLRGLVFRNVDDRIFEVVLPGTGGGDLGIYTHADVVPVAESMWQLPGGDRIHPFRLHIQGDRLFGRGTEDDKCSIVTALFALQTVRESGVTLDRSIRLLVETTEETGGDGMEYYKSRHPLPSHNIVLDSSYPVVTAEKGFGVIIVRFPKQKEPKQPDGPPPSEAGLSAEILEVLGGAAVNQIPENSIARIGTRRPDELRARMLPLLERFLKKEKKPLTFAVEARDREVRLQIKGESAHASQPDQGRNPVSRLLVFLAEHADVLRLESNAHLAAARYAAGKFGTDDYARVLGLDYSDDFMGPLTVVVTQVEALSDSVELRANVRMPRGRDRDELVAALRSRLSASGTPRDVAPQVEVRIEPPMVRDPSRAYIRTLLDIYGGVTGKPAGAVSSAGATTARQLPNGVNFGPSHPGEKYMGHTSLEFKRRDHLLLDLQLFTEMMLRVGRMKELDR